MSEILSLHTCEMMPSLIMSLRLLLVFLLLLLWVHPGSSLIPFWPRSRGHYSAMGAVKKKGGASPPASPPLPQQQEPPRRVGKTPGALPVRQQIAWAKAYKRFMTNSNTPVARRFKKERGPKEVEEEYVEIDYVNTPPPAVFVDGYNVIGQIQRMEGRSLDMDSARDCLVADLAVLKGATGWWIEVVFDAYQASSPQRRDSVDNIFVTFTGPGETADDYIERRFSELQKEGFRNVVVATDDSLLRMTATGLGAGFLTCSMLLEELRIAYKGWEVVEGEMAQAARRARPTLGDGLGVEALEAIRVMRETARARSPDAASVDALSSEGPTSSEKEKGLATASPQELLSVTTSLGPKVKRKDKYVDLKDADWSKVGELATTTRKGSSKAALQPKFPPAKPRDPSTPKVPKPKEKFVSIRDLTWDSFEDLLNL